MLLACIEALLALVPGVEACCVVGANLTLPLAILAMTPEPLKQALEP